MDVWGYFGVAAIIAALGFFMRRATNRKAKERVAHFLDIAFDLSLPPEEIQILQRVAWKAVAAIEVPKKVRLIGGGSASTSPIGEAIFALTTTLNSTSGEEQRITGRALNKLVLFCANAKIQPQMTDLDYEYLCYAQERCQDLRDRTTEHG